MQLLSQTQNEEELEEAREEVQVAEEEVWRKGGSFTASNMETADTPSSCLSWMGARQVDHRPDCTVALEGGQVLFRETPLQSTVSGHLRNCNTWRAKWRTTHSGCRRYDSFVTTSIFYTLSYNETEKVEMLALS